MRAAPPSLVVLLAIVLGLLTTACEVTPGFVERWENRPGSEERFIEWLHREDTSQEVKNKSFELLLRQWEYSGPMFRNPNVRILAGIPSDAARAATVRANLPVMRELTEQGGNWRFRGREQAYYIRRGVTDESLRAEVDAFLIEWFDNHWDPCEAGPSAIGARDVLNLIGREQGEGVIAGVIRNADPHTAMICLRDQAAGVEWLGRSDEVAAAVRTRWIDGPQYTEAEGEDSPQVGPRRIRFLEFIQGMAKHPDIKALLFERIDARDIDASLMLGILGEARSDEDLAALESLVGRDGLARWYAFRTLVEVEGVDGLRRALGAVPASGAFEQWAGDEPREDGFRHGAGIACGSAQLSENASTMRPVLLDAAASGPLPRRTLATVCLISVANADVATRLQAIRGELESDPELPAWGEGTMTLGALMDLAIAQGRSE